MTRFIETAEKQQKALKFQDQTLPQHPDNFISMFLVQVGLQNKQEPRLTSQITTRRNKCKLKLKYEYLKM